MLFLGYNHCMNQKRETIRRRVFDIIQIGNRSDLASRSFDIFIVITILLNIIVTFLQTFKTLAPLHPAFDAIEAVTILIFCVEYALRIWTSRYLFPGESPWTCVRKFLLSYVELSFAFLHCLNSSLLVFAHVCCWPFSAPLQILLSPSILQ